MRSVSQGHRHTSPFPRSNLRKSRVSYPVLYLKTTPDTAIDRTHGHGHGEKEDDEHHGITGTDMGTCCTASVKYGTKIVRFV